MECKHKKYRALRPPRVACQWCWMRWLGLTKMQRTMVMFKGCPIWLLMRSEADKEKNGDALALQFGRAISEDNMVIGAR